MQCPPCLHVTCPDHSSYSPCNTATSRDNIPHATAHRNQLSEVGPKLCNTCSPALVQPNEWAHHQDVRTCLHTASAVALLSPVTTITRMPADLHVWMAARTSARGGSCMATTPASVRDDSSDGFTCTCQATACCCPCACCCCRSGSRTVKRRCGFKQQQGACIQVCQIRLRAGQLCLVTHA